ncbi:MAG TPA: hypothetical protein VF728_09390 [Nocardioides sp.]
MTWRRWWARTARGGPVWVVIADDFMEDVEVVGVFSTESRAKAAADEWTERHADKPAAVSYAFAYDVDAPRSLRG